MSDFYQSGHRALQQEFESTALADRLEELIEHTALDADAQAFIQAQDHFFLTTVDKYGFPTVSYKGGNEGLVKVVDATTLRFPCFDGNGMWLSMGNIEDTGKVGLLFINMVEPNRIRVQGMARLVRDPQVLSQWPDVALAVEVSITNTWINCPRYIHPVAKLANPDMFQTMDIKPSRQSGNHWKFLSTYCHHSHMKSEQPNSKLRA